jgi:predicted CXXCH cytochrome family protein
MKVEVTTLTRRGGTPIRRSRTVEADSLRFGRAPDSEVQLEDLRIELQAAVLSERGGQLTVEKLGSLPVIVNGRPVETSVVRPGDTIDIGPCHLEITEPPLDFNAAFSYELTQHGGNAVAELEAQTGGLQTTGLSKRFASWAGFVLIFLVLLAAPIAVYYAGLLPIRQAQPQQAETGLTPARILALSWNPGEVSNPHRFFVADCKTCHRASFAWVPDNACLNCHATVGNHVEATADIGPLRQTLDRTGCTSCHEEHRGIRGTVIASNGLCLDCHRSLDQKAPAAGIHDVGGFPSGHPQFRVTLVADAAQNKLNRVEIGGNPPPMDRPGVMFSHKAHLDTIGQTSLGDRQVKGCPDCHVAEPGGLGFQPITYKAQCQHCHELTFDRTDLPWPSATVPHGDDIGVVAAVWNYYAGKAIQTGTADNQAAAPTRRAPGVVTPASVQPQADLRASITQKAEMALRTVVLEEKRGCGYCHFGTAADGKFDIDKIITSSVSGPTQTAQHFIAPVSLRTRFLPQAVFNHARHTAVACENCHDARHVESSSAVMIPGIDNCTSCHGKEDASLRAGSSCISCHGFHRNEFGPMRQSAAATQ